jgi:hypothetical protein
MNPDSSPARRRTDHIVMSGKLSIGRIYKRESIVGTPQWTWLINGVGAPPDVMKAAGMAAELEQAEAELKESWHKWLAWAGLQEIEAVSVPDPSSSRVELPVPTDA